MSEMMDEDRELGEAPRDFPDGCLLVWVTMQTGDEVMLGGDSEKCKPVGAIQPVSIIICFKIMGEAFCPPHPGCNSQSFGYARLMIGWLPHAVHVNDLKQAIMMASVQVVFYDTERDVVLV